MDIPKLRTLLSQPPYNGMSNSAAMAALNAQTQTVQGPVSKGKLIQWAAKNNGFLAMERASVYAGRGNPALDEPIQNIGKAAQAMFFGGAVDEFDTASQDNVDMINALVGIGLITQAAANSLMALGATVMSPAEAAGIGYVNIGDIEEAKR